MTALFPLKNNKKIPDKFTYREFFLKSHAGSYSKANPNAI
ncbi:hypothetical protein NT05HA_1073 [Aggregatibacter aphrophilus NJ8700]|nr:hypothetical protein NT05HA_1073 [Aggregatibacter aphrophilus NJ8700]